MKIRRVKAPCSDTAVILLFIFGQSTLDGFTSINRNLLSKYYEHNSGNHNSYTKYEFYHSYSLRIFLILPTGFQIRLKAIDERILFRKKMK